MEWSIGPIFCAAACILAAYLLGSINFAIIVTRLSGKGDIRQYGSGNAGMTNVLRTVGKRAAFFTLLGDFSKGIIALLLTRMLFHLVFHAPSLPVLEYLVAYAALLGHTFPIYYRFKGGKGILVSAGAMLVLSPWSLLLCLLGFLVVTGCTRYVSAGSITAAILFPIGNLLLSVIRTGAIDWVTVLLAIPISVLVIYLHHTNIRRLIDGTENKIHL